jgi:cytochrome P450
VSAVAGPELPAGLPPGSELPRSRQTARWLSRPVEFLESLQRRHGDVFTIHLLQERPWLMVSDPDLIKQIFTAPADVLHAGEQKRILEPILGPASVLLSDGEAHVRRRKLMLPAFHATHMPLYEATMRAAADAEVRRWPLGAVVPAAPRMGAVALEVIVRTVFGASGGERVACLREALERLMDHVASRRSALVAFGDRSRLRDDRFAELRDLLARVDELVFAEIAARRRPGEPGDDMLSLLLEARHEDGSPIADRELRDELMTLVVAGHETTATSLAWALERLVRNPDALAGAATEAAAGGGHYIDAVVRETLRIRPAFMAVPRLVRKSFRLGGRLVPEGVAVTPAIPLVHRRPDVYPNPEAFRPERFLDRQPGTYTWIPFGGGVRRCIGAGFAMLQMRIVLSVLLARATLRPTGAAPEAARRKLLVMAPAGGARVLAEPR